MKALSILCSPRQLVPIAFFGIATLTSAAPKCDDMAGDVRKAIAGDPAKTLMIVEDALVINESCACEIIRAAFEASKADDALKQQIVQTALAVAPKMAPVITECAGLEVTAAAPVEDYGDVTYSGKSGKGAKSVLPILPTTAPVEEVEEFTYIPRDIRGIYLIAPGGVGFIGERGVEEICKCDDNERHDPPPRRCVIRPISRSIARN